MSAPKILFWVQHLLGIGHLRRAATLSAAMQAAGMRVTLVTGGTPVPGLDTGGAELVQLPPTRAVDLFFKQLVDAQDRPVDDAWRDDRRGLLLAAYERIRPDVVMTELYPFGRRQLRHELLPLLDVATGDRPRPLIVSSVRDILVEPGKPERLVEMIGLVRRYYDRVLVHGDPRLVPFEETFPHLGEIAERVRYTGYVVDRPRTDIAAGPPDVLVSAGGGAVGEPLLRAAMAARALTSLADDPWRFLVGHGLPPALYDALVAEAPPGVTVERARPDFVNLLRGCRLSISQAGYNTVMEVLATRARAVVVPYAGGLESEQTLRARRLADRSVLQVVDEHDLSPRSIAAAVERALAAEPAAMDDLDTSGTASTVRLLRDALAEAGHPAAE